MFFILGGSGTGKSRYCFEHMIERAMLTPQENFMIVVPEQFTMETQKEIVSLHPNHGVLNIDIVSFQRLAYRIMNEIGGFQSMEVLDDVGKSMILRKVVEDLSADLQIFKENMKKIGFIDELKSTISELYQYNISTQLLEQAVLDSRDKPLLQHKLTELLTVYKGFRQYLSHHTITDEEVLNKLADSIRDSEKIRNSTIYFDGFTGFTPVQYQVIRQLMLHARDVVFTVTIDARENLFQVEEEYKLFHMSQLTINQLQRMAIEEKCRIEEPVILKKPYRFLQNKPLQHLESKLFRFQYETYTNQQDNIQIYFERNPQGEVEYAATEIAKLVRSGQCRYKEIAIVVTSMEVYAPYIQHVFADCSIPIFIDDKRNMLNHPLIEMLLSMMEVIVKNFSYDSVFRYAKTGLTDCEADEVDYIENYVIAYGVRGYHIWKKEWGQQTKDRSWDFVRLNQIRVKLMEPMFKVRRSFLKKGAKVKDYLHALYEFAVDCNIQHKLTQMSKGFEAAGQLSLALEYKQIYKMTMDLFDKAFQLLGKEMISPKEFAELFRSGAEQCRIGLIPMSMDQVTVGDIERTRLKSIKVLFCMGVNDGLIPASGNSTGLITDYDKEFLADRQIRTQSDNNVFQLSPTEREKVFIQQFYLYLNLTKPSEVLYISCAKTSADGTALRPSHLIHRIRKLFPKLEPTQEGHRTRVTDNELPVALMLHRTAWQYLIEGLRELKDKESRVPEVLKALTYWYRKDAKYSVDLKKIMDALFYVNAQKGLSANVAEALFGNVLSGSVTRLEQFAACGFSYFLKYGLQLEKRKELKLETSDLGNMFHEALQLFAEKMEYEKLDPFTLGDEDREVLVNQVVDHVINQYATTVLSDTARNRYILERVRRMTGKTVWALMEQLKKGRFTPKLFEEEFELRIPIGVVGDSGSEAAVQLKGRIDRIDTYAENDNVYVKIIDYKSGSTSYDLSLIYHGLQMQLAVYMNAARKLLMKQYEQAFPKPEIQLAGMFYYHILEPLVDRYQIKEDETPETAVLKELRMKGLVVMDMDRIEAMDRGIKETGKSQVIPVEITKSNVIKSSSSTAHESDFENLLLFTEEKIKKIGKEILTGRIPLNPYQMKDRTACDYCQYHGVCQFDPRFDSDKYHVIQEEKPDNLWKKIEKDCGGSVKEIGGDHVDTK